jgi:hypothetical protein
MRKFMMAILATAALGVAEPAMAYSGDLGSMQMALDVATNLGLVAVEHTQFMGDEWQIEGRDVSGRWMEVYIDANTGAVRNLYR